MLAVGLVTTGTFASVAGAQNVDTSDWVCEFCPFESGHKGDYDVGAGVVSDDSAYFHNASGLGEEGVVGLIDGYGSYITEGQQLRWTIEDLALDSRFAEISGGRQGSYDYELAYREIPRRVFMTTDSVFTNQGADAVALPEGWVRSGSTAGFSQLDTSLARQDIEGDRSFLDIGGRYLTAGAFSFSADYRRQKHDGTSMAGGASFTTSSLLPLRFDYTTDEVDVGIRYGIKNGFLALGWYLSDFDSGGNSFTWENPFTTAAGAELGELARPPDNSFQQLTLSGGYSFDEYATYVSFTASAGQMEQNAAFVPYTTNPNIGTPLPRSNLDGEIDTSKVAIAVVTKPIDQLRVRMAFRYDDRDNKTSRELWNRIITDTFASGDAEENIPYSFRRSTLNVSADFDLLDDLRLSGGYDRKETNRDFQEVAQQTDDRGWARLRWRPNAIFDIDIEGGVSQRDIDRYSEQIAVSLDQNPLLRKYNLAYRYRKFGELRLTASMPEAPVSLTLSGMYADDSYSESVLGMLSGEELRLAADLGWSVSDRASLYLTVGTENIESDQAGSESFATADWQASNDDDFLTYGGGFRVLKMSDNIDLHFDYTRSEGTSDIRMNTAGGGQSRFPELESTLDNLSVRVAYQRSERLGLSASLRFQRFVAEDWSLDGVEPATIPQVLSLGANAYDDEVLIFGLSFRYRVGAAATGSAGAE